MIDNIDNSITSNITRVKIRRNLNALINLFAQYELCFGNKFNVKPEGLNIKSTGFRIQGESETVFITDTPNADKLTGVISIVKKDETTNTNIVVVKSAGTVDYVHGEVNLTTINIVSGEDSSNFELTSFTIPALIPINSSLVIPGFLGIPDVITQISLLAVFE